MTHTLKDERKGLPMSTLPAPLKILGACALVAFVAACGGRETPVRGVPQAVHPSPSALAQGTGYAQAPAPVATVTHYTPHANDGSQPIID
jgi:hypothetical protein